MKKILLIFISLMMFITSCGKTEAVQEKEIVLTWQEKFDLGMKYLLEENYEEAIIAFTAAIEIDSKQAIVYVNRGQAYILLEETGENLTAAIADFEQAIVLEETNAEAYLGLVEAYIRKNEYEKAYEILKEGLEKTGGNQKIADKISEIESGTILDSQGKVRKQSGYNAEGQLIWYHQFEYQQDGKEKSVTAYDSNGEEMGHVDIMYDAEGRTVRDYVYGQTSGLLYAQDNIYDSEGNKIEEVIYEITGDVGYRDKYTYENNLLIYMDRYDAENSLLEHHVYEYNAQGLNTKLSLYLPDGRLGLYYMYEYNARGDISEYAEYLYNGETRWKEVFIYDEKGEFIGKDLYDAEGNLVQSLETSQ